MVLRPLPWRSEELGEVAERAARTYRQVKHSLASRYPRVRNLIKRVLGVPTSPIRPSEESTVVTVPKLPDGQGDVTAQLSYSGPDPVMTSEEVERLRSLRNTFSGERIFIMGNGPSLNKIDLELLDGEFVFAMNRVSLLFERVSWRPQLFTAFDLRVVPDNLDEFNDLDVPLKFFATKHKGAILDRENHYWYHDRSTPNDFVDRFSGTPEITGFGGGGTISCVAIQIAAFLGFDPIILIGCDASYKIPDSVKQVGPDKFGDGTRLNLQSTEDDDANHFDPRYFGAGRRWHSPNTTEMHVGFEKSYRAMAAVGRTLVNATYGGALESVPRVDYSRLFVGPVDETAAELVVGIDLTNEMAAKQTGMRTSLVSTLRNTLLVGGDVRFVLISPDDGRRAAYATLLENESFSFLSVSDHHYSEQMAALDGVVFPFNDIASELAIEPSTKRIAYLNDLIPIKHQGYSESLRRRYEAIAESADAIVCLTDRTKEEIVDNLGVEASLVFVSPPSAGDEVTVVPVSDDYELISADDIAAVRGKVGTKFTYLIYPAAFRPHKNHRVLLEAMRYVYTNLELVLTTGETHKPEDAARIQESIDVMGLSHRIHIAEGLPRSEYLALLKGAEALVCPSLDEGFGIPVAEAQSLRVAVISSRCGALGEVALGSMEIDPTDHMDIAAKITDLISDDELKEAVAENGWRNSRRYTKEWGPNGLISAIYSACRG